jgi:hypothetical protein
MPVVNACRFLYRVDFLSSALAVPQGITGHYRSSSAICKVFGCVLAGTVPPQELLFAGKMTLQVCTVQNHPGTGKGETSKYQRFFTVF